MAPRHFDILLRMSSAPSSTGNGADWIKTRRDPETGIGDQSPMERLLPAFRTTLSEDAQLGDSSARRRHHLRR